MPHFIVVIKAILTDISFYYSLVSNAARLGLADGQ
jgi:hypothetical protein